ncbi:MAG: SDR family oxidoreductase [Planctomycetota bacterium]|jgi:NAD(P)-dependent dehydrogenase (short-subunit alcohol dehydrogenase family)|nr:SDR family oxidoreductase [Planctomycetota bacterium]
MAEALSGEGRLALVTGATRGIGLAISRRLRRRGHRVIGVYGHDERAAGAAREELGSGFIPVKADLSRVEGIAPLAAAVDGAGGILHYLVANVGVTDKTPFGEVSPDAWERVLRTNLTVPFFLVQALAGRMPEGEGRLLFIGAAMGRHPHGLSLSYGASKAGLHFLARSLVKVLSPRGITVNVAAPGFVETAMQGDKAPDHRRRVEQKIGLRRFADPDEVAAAAESLLELGYVTGGFLAVDGGYGCE